MNRTLSVGAVGVALAWLALTAVTPGVGWSLAGEGEAAVAVKQPVEFPLVFDMPTVDLGEVSDAADVSHAFSFVNTSAHSVRVELRNYCHHCEKPEIVPTLVGPGKSGVVIVDLKTTGKSGLIRGGASIGVQGLAEPTVEITAMATVVPDAEFQPPMLQVGEVPIGERRGGEVSLLVRTPGAEVRSVKSSTRQFEAETGRPEEHKIGNVTGTRIPVKIQIASDLPAGYHVGHVQLETSSGQHVSLPVNVQILSSLKATPADVGLGRLVGGDEFKAEITLAMRDATPVRILSMGVRNPTSYTEGSVHNPVDKLSELNLAYSVDESRQLARLTLSGRAPLSTGGYEIIVAVQGARGPGDVLEVPVRFRVRF